MAPLEVVFPTLVGVFLFTALANLPSVSLPHARGGVSKTGGKGMVGAVVFPTLVGVFPKYILYFNHL